MQDIEAPLVAGAGNRQRQHPDNIGADETSPGNNSNNPSPREAPSSRGVPRSVSSVSKHHKQGTATCADVLPRLIHPFLHKLPLHFRFGCNGLLSNVLFMVVYNYAVTMFPAVAASKIYAVLYLFFIPFSHLLAAVLVFGWPERYFPSLMSNFPIGLTAIGLGSGLTAYLDRVEFNERIEEYIRDNFSFSQMPPRSADEKSEFYSSLLVLLVTSLWTYVLSVYINSAPTKSEQKQD